MDTYALRNYSDLIGKEFKHGASGPDNYDCYHLCQEVLKRNGIEIPDFSPANDKGLIHQTILEGRELFTRIDRPKRLCLVTFRMHPKYVTHVGVVLKPPYFMHIMQNCRAVVERLDSPEWARRTEGFYQWKS